MTEHRSAEEVVAGLDLRGKTIAVTGVSSGLGVESAHVLSKAGARVIGAARDLDKARKALDGANVDLVPLDLSSLASVRACAAAIDARAPRLDVLLNNAGIMACPQGSTQDGFELQFGTNHLGHFLLTCLLVPRLLASAPARVVCLSSGAHRIAGVDLDDPGYARKPYAAWEAYGRSKSANALFAVELDRRLRGRGVRANAVHPGVIVTELGRHLTPDTMKEMTSRASSSSAGGLKFKPVTHGAATQVWAAVSPELDGVGGRYLEDVRIAEPAREDTPTSGYAAHAVDPEIAERLWTLSEKLVGQRFDF